MLTKQDLQAITTIIQTEIQTANEKQSIDLEKKMEKGFKKLDKKIVKFFDFLDVDVVKLRQRVERIEDHLKLPSSS